MYAAGLLLATTIMALPTRYPVSYPSPYGVPPVYGQPPGFLPWLATTIGPMVGEVPLQTHVFGQGFRTPDGRSFQGAFTLAGPGILGRGRTGAYRVSDGRGRNARGKRYAMAVRSPVDGRRGNAVGSAEEQHYTFPGGEGHSFSSSYSSISE